MKNKSKFIINSSINLIGYFFLLLTSFFSIPYILNSIGKEVFGIYILFMASITITSIFDLGISQAATRLLCLDKYDNKKINIWQTSWTLHLILSIFVSVFSFLILMIMINVYPSFSIIDIPHQLTIIFIISLIIFTNIINAHLLTIPQVQQKFYIYNIKTFIVGSGNTIFTAMALYYTSDLKIAFTIQLIFHIITSIILFSYNIKILSIKAFYLKIDKNIKSELIKFGGKTFIGKIVNQIKAHFSKYILGALLAPSAITYFSIPYSLVEKPIGAISQISLALFPLSTNLSNKKNNFKMRKLFILLQIMIFMIGSIGVILIFIFGNQFLFWWLKDQSIADTSFPILKILSIFLVMTSLTPVPKTILESINKPHIPSYFAVIDALIQISLLIYLTIKMGIIGTAYAILISTLIIIPPFIIYSYIIFNKHINRINS